MAAWCSFCGATSGPSGKVEGLVTVLMYADRPRPISGHDRAELRTGLDLLPTWALGQKAAANREVSAVMRQRLAAGEAVARMCQGSGLSWLERQAEVAEELVARRRPTVEDRPGS